MVCGYVCIKFNSQPQVDRPPTLAPGTRFPWTSFRSSSWFSACTVATLCNASRNLRQQSTWCWWRRCLLHNGAALRCTAVPTGYRADRQLQAYIVRSCTSSLLPLKKVSQPCPWVSVGVRGCPWISWCAERCTEEDEETSIVTIGQQPVYSLVEAVVTAFTLSRKGLFLSCT